MRLSDFDPILFRNKREREGEREREREGEREGERERERDRETGILVLAYL